MATMGGPPGKSSGMASALNNDGSGDEEEELPHPPEVIDLTESVPEEVGQARSVTSAISYEGLPDIITPARLTRYQPLPHDRWEMPPFSTPATLTAEGVARIRVHEARQAATRACVAAAALLAAENAFAAAAAAAEGAEAAAEPHKSLKETRRHQAWIVREIESTCMPGWKLAPDSGTETFPGAYYGSPNLPFPPNPNLPFLPSDQITFPPHSCTCCVPFH